MIIINIMKEKEPLPLLTITLMADIAMVFAKTYLSCIKQSVVSMFRATDKIFFHDVLGKVARKEGRREKRQLKSGEDNNVSVKNHAVKFFTLSILLMCTCPKEMGIHSCNKCFSTSCYTLDYETLLNTALTRTKTHYTAATHACNLEETREKLTTVPTRAFFTSFPRVVVPPLSITLSS